jgi:hypothetical protein
MLATKLAGALTIFASYAPAVQIEYQQNAYRLYGYSEDAFKSMTLSARSKLFSLGWCISSDGEWYLPD